jgi:DNA-binding transcriptional ArsR family regulator
MPVEDVEPARSPQPSPQGPPRAGEQPQSGLRPELRTISDARTMRALSHPVRIALVEALSVRGAMTATEVGEVIGESPTTCSFHLRQLARYGWVEEAGGGKGRARPWRMTFLGFQFPSADAGPEASIAASTLSGLLRERQLSRYQAWVETKGRYPRKWREAAADSEFFYYMTAEELVQLVERIHQVLWDQFDEARITDPSRRPPGAVPVELLLFAYPTELPPPASGDGPSPGEDA